MVTLKLYQRLAAMALIAALLFTTRLWTGDHGLGLLPLYPGLTLGTGGAVFLYALMLLSGVGLLIWPARAGLKGLMVAALAIAIAADVNRFQVWLLHYVFILLLPERLSHDEAKASVVGMISVTYFFSACHKFNASFRDEVFPWFTDSLGVSVGTSWYWIFPGGELLTAVLLMTSKTERTGHFCAIAMHLTIMTVLVLRHWNYSVLPWNVMLVGLHVGLCAVRPWRYTRDWRGLAVAGALGVPAVLGFAGVFHDSFSYCLYAGNQYAAVVVLSETCLTRLPHSVAVLSGRFKANGEPFVDLDRLSLALTGAPRFQAQESFRRCAGYFIPHVRHNDDLVLLVRRGDGMRMGENLWVFSADDINQ